jgi:hypothetical protein
MAIPFAAMVKMVLRKSSFPSSLSSAFGAGEWRDGKRKDTNAKKHVRIFSDKMLLCFSVSNQGKGTP